MTTENIIGLIFFGGLFFGYVAFILLSVSIKSREKFRQGCTLNRCRYRDVA